MHEQGKVFRVYKEIKLKVLYYDDKNKEPTYLGDHPECRILMVMREEGDIYVYYAHEPESKTYINKVINKYLQPLMFLHSNLMEIQDDEEFNYVEGFITAMANYNGIHKGEELSGHDAGSTLILPQGMV